MNKSELTEIQKSDLEQWLKDEDLKKVSQELARISLADLTSNYQADGFIDSSDLVDFQGGENLQDSDIDNDGSFDKLSESSEKITSLQAAMHEMSINNCREAVRTKHNLEEAQLGWQLALKLEQQNILKANPRTISTRNQSTDLIRSNITKIEKQLTDLRNLTPESWGALHGLELRKNIQEIDQGKLVKTPYVERNLNRLKKNMESGQPTLIHGHLGSGKTELAITAAKESVLESRAIENANYDYQQWLDDQKQNSLTPTGAERRAYLAKAYRRNLNDLSARFSRGDSDVVNQVAPLIISGSKDLTSQDLYSEKTLKLSKFNGKSILEHKKDIDSEIAQWQEDNRELLDTMSNEERRKAEADAANKILEIYKLKNQAFGTEVETIQKEIYRGVTEGRPVIIDEVNAIPSAVLISMNDILQRRPGQSCFIPGVGSVKIKPGFSVTMTGNLSSDRVSYEGTNELNPAFLSRLDVFEHDYLPQSCEDRNYNDQIDPKKNELFRVMLTHMVDRHGHLQLPEMHKSLSQLFSLAQLARSTQDIFSEKWVESHVNTTVSGDEVEPRLEKAVLSIRNILSVMQEWNKGSDKNLDMALWDGFISRITNPDDQSLILSLAQKYNFFKQADGWNIISKPVGSGSLTGLSEIRIEDYKHQLQPLETMPMIEVLEMIAGNPPERTQYPDLNKIEFNDFADEDTDVTPEQYIEISEKINTLNQSTQALEALFNKMGCAIETKE